ncbi:MAG: hypothetical protein JO022_06475 [Acidobacteriaceae bacterium]|nr:hypothetical protein [Acidobacteriaceae bacterium]
MFSQILDRKIAQLKKDEAYLKMLVNIGGLAFDVATNFLAPLAMGGGLLRMSKFLFQAYKRLSDWHNFRKEKTAMIKAASAYSAPIRRFITDAGTQGAYYSLNAACEGVKIVGAVLQVTPAVIGGIIATQVSTSIEAVAAVVYEIDKRHQLSVAWSTYKLAINNPGNRKLALIAMRQNPTLAKYAMAWGAVVEQDPLVGDFLGYCGINTDTVQGSANIDKVVEYLEARMPDDITVVGRDVGPSAGWAPKKVELTTGSWMDAKARAETTGGVAAVDTAAIESALTKYEEARAALEKAKDASKTTREAKLKAAINCVIKADAAIRTYFPKDAKNGGRNEEMWEVLEMFYSKASIEKTALEQKLEDIKKEKPKPVKKKTEPKKKLELNLDI